MAARIYVIPISHPSAAGVAMLRHKRIPQRVVRLVPGLHPCSCASPASSGTPSPRSI
jgi:hypothetical protein